MGAPAFAIYLNSAARRVSPDVIAQIEELVHPDDIYYCSSRDDAARHAGRILERGYPTVFTGGGDGTVFQLVNAMRTLARRRGKEGRIPTLGVLSLGTGNALSRLVSSGSAVQDLKSYVTNPSSDVWPVSLVSWEGQVFPFGSLGVDAEILSDYIAMKDGIGAGPLKPLFQNVGGYFMAFFGVTVPRHLWATVRREQTTLRVTNLADHGYQIGPDGEMTRSFGPGEAMYEGTSNLVVLGTIPCYGYGLKLLPFADRHADFMQVRVSRMGLLDELASLPAVWRGAYRGDGLRDYYASRVRVEWSEPMPFQMAGDLASPRGSADFELVPSALNLLRFI